ncbi:MAG: hypothetical protein R3E32_28430 [Chitinophagales bacterium]
MRKIDKKCSLSIRYKKWEEGLEAKNKKHPKIDTSTKRYADVVMQLFHCQDGLCAYTERRLCDSIHYEATKWKEGKYASSRPKRGIEGDLEHFDEKLKAKKKDKEGIKDWLWDNLFVVHPHINQNVKGSKSIDKILKPDREDYDPFELLDYDEEEHVYRPKKTLSKEDFQRVETMIETLGINHFYNIRRDYLAEKLDFIQRGINSWEDFLIDRFPTAFEMCKQNILRASKTKEPDIDLDDFLKQNKL